jgi:hypothetical protein
MFCSNCGENIDPQTQVCARCGTPSATATQANPPAPAVTPSSLPTLSPPSEVRSAVPAPPSVQPQNDGKAIFSLVLGILSVTCLWVIAGIPAIILGHMSVSSIRKSMGRLKGQGMAIAGLIMGYISCAASIPIILIIIAVAIPNILRAKISATDIVGATTVRTLNIAETTYTVNYPTQGFADLAALGAGAAGNCSSPDSSHACIIDAPLSCASTWCAKDSFRYNITLKSPRHDDYVITATPIPGQGSKSFCSTGDSVIHYRLGTVEEPATEVECQSWEIQ